ncbi:hypothetical protein GOBAR_DD00010 [Gossypium barbadense]|nr:hypothetical protein GOBAR_DD00010 [Gossypium barbadense]
MEEFNRVNGNSIPKGNFVYASPVVATETNTSQNPPKLHLLRDQQEAEDMKAKIIAHPHCSNLFEAYMDCQKVGAPPEVAARLAAARQEFEARRRSAVSSTRDTIKDPELDQFMEAYYGMLVKYRDELMRPMQEALDFTRRTEAQLNRVSNGLVQIFNSVIVHNYVPGEIVLPHTNSYGYGKDARLLYPRTMDVEYVRSYEKCDGVGSSEEEENNNHSNGETKTNPRAEDRELKNQLLRKYRGYLSSLKQELSKKKKKGKLPKESRQKLLTWWELHYKWPYPSETEKVALAESTGLDQKQINNWFINQRKRHWKPSEDSQFMVMDGLHSPNAVLYMDGHYMGGGPYRPGPS